MLDSLDFLGFSRSNRDLSMGYAGFSRKNISRALCRGGRSAGTGACGPGHAEAQDCSWGKLSLVSDFLQEIVVRAVPFRPPQSKSRSLEAASSKPPKQSNEGRAFVVVQGFERLLRDERGDWGGAIVEIRTRRCQRNEQAARVAWVRADGSKAASG